MEADADVEPEIGVGLRIQGDHFLMAGVGLNPAVLSEIDDEVDAVVGDGEVAREQGAGDELFEGAFDWQRLGETAVAL